MREKGWRRPAATQGLRRLDELDPVRAVVLGYLRPGMPRCPPQEQRLGEFCLGAVGHLDHRD
ncbi:MAG: hypothetical protein ABGY41_18050, partial [Candidatus Poribacteria bacterium]